MRCIMVDIGMNIYILYAERTNFHSYAPEVMCTAQNIIRAHRFPVWNLVPLGSPTTAPGLVRGTTSNLFSLVAPLLDSFLLAETAPLLSLRDISPNGGISGIGEASPYRKSYAQHRKQSGRIRFLYGQQRRRRVALPSGDDSPTVWGKCRKATKGDGRSKRLARRSRD